MVATVFFRNGYLLSLSIIVILVAGISSVINLPRLEDPRIDLRHLFVLTSYPGASAERVEALVTDVLEDELRTLFEIKEIESTSTAGFSSIVIELQDWVDNSTNQQIFSKIRDRVDQASQRFPEGVGEAFVDDQRGATAFTLTTSLTPKHNSILDLNILGRLSEELADRLRNVPGTELVRRYGAPVEEIQVTINPNQLALTGLSINQVSELIALADPKLPAGALYNEDQNIRIQMVNAESFVDKIEAIPLISREGRVLRLGDIADVKKQWLTPERQIAYVNGNRAIKVASRMQTKVRVDKWTEQSKDIIEQFEHEFGNSISVEIIFEQNQYTETRLNELTQNLLLGCAVVMTVILFFMGLRASIIVGLALPMCAAFALFSLGFYGQQIHQMTIFGIIIAIGLLIDNAIVITDDIRLNLLRPEYSRKQALIKSTRHLLAPLFASTLTTILGFMPIFLLTGNIGDFVGPIAISVVMALIGSLLISLTIIAALAARYLPRERSQEQSWLFKGIDTPVLSLSFKMWLIKVVQRPKIVISAVVVFCLSGFVLSSQLGNVFFPSADRDQFEIYVWAKEGQSINRTKEQILAIDEDIRAKAGVKHVDWLVGASYPSVYYNQIMRKDSKPNYANGVVTTTSVSAAATLIDKLQRELQAAYPELKIVVRAFGQGPPIAAPVEVIIYGPDVTVLDELGKQVRLAMSELPGISQSVASITFSEPEFTLEMSNDIASQSGNTLTGVASDLQSMLTGTIRGSVMEDTEEIPIRVRVADHDRANITSIGSIPLVGSLHDAANAGWASLDSLGELILRPSISGISRENGERLNRVQAYLYASATALDVNNQLREKLAQRLVLPDGYRFKFAGDADQQQQALGQLATYMPVLLVLMITTLVLTFSSVRLAVAIGAVAFLSVGLGFFSLWLSGLPIGFNPILGSAGLIGVTINGSIVVIAAIKANNIARQGDIESIIEETMGCSRHILSTTFTTVGGLIPLLLFSEGSFWPPLAVVIAGGVGFSIVLSLIFTPAVVSLLAKSNRGL